MRKNLRVPLISAIFALSACATTPAPHTVSKDGFRMDLPPHQVAEADPAPHDRVRWGGMIVEVRNHERFSEIEVLAYPLDRKFRPILKLPTEGRFVAVMPGYIEPYDWPQGRFMTVHGTISGTREGMIDEKLYVYPVVDVAGSQLWPAGFQNRGPHFSVGIGVGVGH